MIGRRALATVALLSARARAATLCTAGGKQANATLLTMGEAMLRLAPLDGAAANVSPTRHLPQPFLRSIGGDELNVAVALSLLNVSTRWISVVPTGPMGDVITESCRHYGVEFDGVRADGDVGIFTVLPEEKRVHYQRRNAVFAQQDPQLLDWQKLFGGVPTPWLHMTGITPLISPQSRESWDNALAEAKNSAIPVSLDLNHRAQLGTLEALWAMVAPHTSRLELLILSVEQLNGLAAIELGAAAPPPLTGDERTDEPYFEVMATLQKRWGARRVSLCRKIRDSATGVQRRWSVMTMRGEGEGEGESGIGGVGTYSTRDVPVRHVPMDDLGGGSAWAAGMIHALHMEPTSSASPLAAMRRADLLAALCQNTAGDFSAVTRAELRGAEARFEGVEARLDQGGGGGGGVARAQSMPAPALPAPHEAVAAVEAVAQGLKRAGALAILRVKSPSVDAAVARGVELAAMGCNAIEVTLDSPGWREILGRLHAELPPHVLLGVGTVMDETVSQVAAAKSLGASFALSPIDPVGFVDECHRHGVLAVPSAFTSNEWYGLHRRGAKMIKLFHAGLVSPSILKSMLGVTPLGEQMTIMPSGGVTPKNAPEWWDAGAAVVGMGSNLVGSSINFEEGTAEYERAQESWLGGGGKAVAQELFDRAAERAAAMSSRPQGTSTSNGAVR